MLLVLVLVLLLLFLRKNSKFLRKNSEFLRQNSELLRQYSELLEKTQNYYIYSHKIKNTRCKGLNIGALAFYAAGKRSAMASEQKQMLKQC